MVNMAPDNHADMADAYKEDFDLLTATRDERTKYNQYFITLLFTDTLFAIFTALLGASSATVYPNPCLATATCYTLGPPSVSLSCGFANYGLLALSIWQKQMS